MMDSLDSAEKIRMVLGMPWVMGDTQDGKASYDADEIELVLAEVRNMKLKLDAAEESAKSYRKMVENAIGIIDERNAIIAAHEKSSAVEKAAYNWWKANRPAAWDEIRHLKDPTINCFRMESLSLAEAVAEAVDAKRYS